jgi:hypothetical protein
MWQRLLVVLCVAAGVPQASTDQPSGTSDVLLIDGSKEPGQIPEWLTWEHGFVILAGWKGRDSGFNHDLKAELTSTEFDALQRVADGQFDRRARFEAKTVALRTKLDVDSGRKEAAEAFDAQVFDLELAYRRQVLAARDRLLQALSADSQTVVQSWMNELKHDMTASVPKSDLARWRMPE